MTIENPSQISGAPRGAVATSLAAIGSLLVAVSCCLPVGPLVAAAGLAGASAFLDAARPYLAGLSVAMLLLGFIRAYAGSQCHLRRSRVSVALLWIAAALTVLLLGFPQVVAGWVAGR